MLVSDHPDQVTSWREHFAEVRRWFFSAVLGTVVFAVLRTWLVHELRADFAVVLALLGVVVTAGILTSRRAVHAVILVVWLAFQFFAMSQFFTAA